MTTRAALWNKWQRQMGTISERDLSVARSWFEELWQAGYDSKGSPVARPLSYEERQVYQLGREKGAGA